MGNYTEILGDLIELSKQGKFDAITHGCNCFSTMGSGIAPLMAKAFDVNKYPLEDPTTAGDINKLGQIEFRLFQLESKKSIFVVNSYTQYNYNKTTRPFDYEAFILCMRKINKRFSGKHIGLPGLIGCGLAGGDPEIVKEIIKAELKDCDVTIVYLRK